VIVQAGASPAGCQLAAETAEVVFGAPPSIEAARSYYADLRARMAAIGRGPDTLRYLPGAFVIVAPTKEEAIQRRAELDSLVHYDSGIGSLNSMLGYDVSGFDPDGPLPEIPETNSGRSQRERMVNLARDKGLTIRELAQAAGSYGGVAFVGTPDSIADEMQEWLESEACDGFNVMFPWLPGGLDDVVDLLIPELQRRELFRRDYQGATLRDHLGLHRPPNRFFPEPR